jgi:hypothetical protein
LFLQEKIEDIIIIYPPPPTPHNFIIGTTVINNTITSLLLLDVILLLSLCRHGTQAHRGTTPGPLPSPSLHPGSCITDLDLDIPVSKLPKYRNPIFQSEKLGGTKPESENHVGRPTYQKDFGNSEQCKREYRQYHRTLAHGGQKSPKDGKWGRHHHHVSVRQIGVGPLG